MERDAHARLFGGRDHTFEEVLGALPQRLLTQLATGEILRILRISARELARAGLVVLVVECREHRPAATAGALGAEVADRLEGQAGYWHAGGADRAHCLDPVLDLRLAPLAPVDHFVLRRPAVQRDQLDALLLHEA